MEESEILINIGHGFFTQFGSGAQSLLSGKNTKVLFDSIRIMKYMKLSNFSENGKFTWFKKYFFELINHISGVSLEIAISIIIDITRIKIKMRKGTNTLNGTAH